MNRGRDVDDPGDQRRRCGHRIEEHSGSNEWKDVPYSGLE